MIQMRFGSEQVNQRFSYRAPLGVYQSEQVRWQGRRDAISDCGEGLRNDMREPMVKRLGDDILQPKCDGGVNCFDARVIIIAVGEHPLYVGAY
jgi:hypothetical protein